MAKPTIPEVVARFAAYHEKPGNGAWGSLHIILDDDNVSDGDCRFCIESATEKGDTEGAELAAILLSLHPGFPATAPPGED